MNMRLVALLGSLAVSGAVWVWSAPGPPAPPMIPPAPDAAPAANTTARPDAGSAALPASPSRRAAARDGASRSSAVAPRNTRPNHDTPFDLDDVRARLRERRTSAPAPSSPERNPFVFGHETPDPDAHAARGNRTHPPEPAPPVYTAPLMPPPPVLKLSGIAESRAGERGDQIVRTAIISGQDPQGRGQLFFAKVGDPVGPLYLVTAIGPDIVELREAGTERTIRLTMR